MTESPDSTPTDLASALVEPEELPWEWRYADEAGVGVAGPPMTFGAQESAEAWLADHLDDLRADGITAVSLFDGERIVYGPMPLTPDS
jgi:hypothetical protein